MGSKTHIHLATGKPFKKGARPTPRHRLAAAMPHRIMGATPALVTMVPPQLSMWLNNVDGDCVTAEEAWAKAAYSVFLGMPELFITDDTVQVFASANGLLNGADLDQVIQLMQQQGFSQGGQVYKDGPETTVDYSNEPVLQNAISIGPVKIGIDADALPSGAGNQMAWVATGGSPGQYNSEDHCVGLGGYGTGAQLLAALQAVYPSAQPSAPIPATGYLLFTWDTIGIVDHQWIMSTCGEAWLRNPTTPGEVPTPPVPPVPPVPPTPPVVYPTPQGATVTLTDGSTWTGTLAQALKGMRTTPTAFPWSQVIAALLEALLAYLNPPVPTPTKRGLHGPSI